MKQDIEKLRLWTGRVVEVFFHKESPGTKPCTSRHCGHFTAGRSYQCCYCGSLFTPLLPDANLGPEATARAHARAPIDPKTIAAWREAAKKNDRGGEAARKLLARFAPAALPGSDK